jgi:hypothetical protein
VVIDAIVIPELPGHHDECKSEPDQLATSTPSPRGDSGEASPGM